MNGESDVSSQRTFVVVSGPISEVSDQRLSGICDTPRGSLRLSTSEHNLQFGVVSLQFDEENITNRLKSIWYFECCPLSEGTEGYFSKYPWAFFVDVLRECCLITDAETQDQMMMSESNIFTGYVPGVLLESVPRLRILVRYGSEFNLV